MATRVTALILTLGFSLSVRAEEVPQYEWKKITMTAEFATERARSPTKGRCGWNPIGKYWKFFPRICNKDVWHSADGTNWHEVPDTPWKPRHAASLFVHSGSLWMVAGNNMEPDVWKLQRKSK